MRLIDADALIDDLKHDVAVDQDSLDYEELTDLNRENIQFDKDCKQNAIDLLQHAPTIEPQRKTGQWLLEIGTYLGGHPRFRYHCSVCGNVEEHVYADSKCANFCPNCGAEMENDDD